ncbi:hypothetical protein Tco_1242139 [Tanacetum coccineum]
MFRGFFPNTQSVASYEWRPWIKRVGCHRDQLSLCDNIAQSGGLWSGILHSRITGNQNGYNAVQNVGNQNGNQTRNGNVVAARAGGNGNGNNGDIDEIEEVNANNILMANLQQA